MSENIVKLRIDSKEYDANIKRAGQALTDYFNKVKEGGGTLKYLDDGVLEAVQAMGELGTLANNTKGGLRELTQAITDMTVAYRSLTDEEKNSPLGEAMQQSIQQMTDRAGAMKDAMEDVQNAITKTASDTRTFDQMAGAVTFATSAFQSLQGAGKLLGIEMGDNVEVIAKLQAAMAITNGLTQMQTLLQKESAFMQGVTAAKAAISATAHGILAGQITAATIAQRALNLAMRAAPWAIAATAIYAVVTAISKSSEVTDKETAKRNAATEAMKRERAERERLAQKAKDHACKVSSSTGDMISKYRVLQEEWNTLKTNQEKNDFIKDNTSAFNAFGTSIRNAADAQRFFVEQADKVIEVLKTMAEAEAFKDLLTDAIKKKYTTDPSKVDYNQYKLTSNEVSAYTPTQRWLGMYSGSYLYYDKNKYSAANNQKYIQDFINANKELKDAGITPNDYWSDTSDTHRVFHLSSKGIGKIQNTRLSNIIKNATDELNSDVEEYTKKYSDSIKKVQELQADMPLFNGGKGNGNGNGNGNGSKHQTEEQENSAMITKLVEEYQKLATAEKTADDEQKKGIADRKTAIQGEIKTLTERNAELKKFADEAKGLANVKPVEWVKGLSGFNAQTMSAWMQGRQGDLQKVDYGTADYKAISGNIADMTAVKSMLETTIKNAIDTTQIDMTQLWEKIFGEPVPEGATASLADVLTKMYEQAFDDTDISDTAIQSVVDKINEALEEKGIKLKIDADTGSVSESKIEKKTGKKNPYITENADGSKTVKATQLMSGMASGITQMTNGLKDLGFKIPSGFEKTAKGISDVVSVLQGITTITQVISAIVTAIQAMTAMQTTESTIKSIPVIGWALAGGGMIRAASGTLVGNSYSGDNLRGIDTNGQLYGLNAGEIVLNRAQQGVLADMINNEGRSGIDSQPYVTGEAIYLGLQNYTRRRGLGEMVTSRRG